MRSPRRPEGFVAIARLISILAVALALGACDLGSGEETARTPTAAGPRSASPIVTGRVPSAPGFPSGSPDPAQPPVAWIGGTIQQVDSQAIRLQEPSGSVVRLQLLGEGGTAFFRASGGSWRPTDAEATGALDDPACVETLLSGSNMLALRVFLGADCGPT